MLGLDTRRRWARQQQERSGGTRLPCFPGHTARAWPMGASPLGPPGARAGHCPQPVTSAPVQQSPPTAQESTKSKCHFLSSLCPARACCCPLGSVVLHTQGTHVPLPEFQKDSPVLLHWTLCPGHWSTVESSPWGTGPVLAQFSLQNNIGVGTAQLLQCPRPGRWLAGAGGAELCQRVGPRACVFPEPRQAWPTSWGKGPPCGLSFPCQSRHLSRTPLGHVQRSCRL